MKQQNAYKLLAALMILIMIIVPVAYVVTSPASQSEQPPQNSESQQDKYDPSLWNSFTAQPFGSISDALNLTPPGARMAAYADLDSMTPQMIQLARANLPVNDVDSLYKSNTTKIYYAGLPNSTSRAPNFLLLSTMSVEKNDFPYIVIPGTNNILRREDTGAINIMGTPVIYAPQDQTAAEVLEIIYSLNKTNTSYDQYKGLLDNVDVAPLQEVNSTVSFADQFYRGVRETNGSYERTTAYLNLNPSIVKKFNQLKTNSTQRGFTQYSINQSGNYTIVKVSAPDLFTVWYEEYS